MNIYTNTECAIGMWVSKMTTGSTTKHEWIASTCKTDGMKFISKGIVIAEYIPEAKGFVLGNLRHNATTTKHQNLIRKTIQMSGASFNEVAK